LSRVLALQYFLNTIDDAEIESRSKKHLLYNTIPFLVLFLSFTAILLFKEGFSYNTETKLVSMESFKYLHNLLQMPVVLILFLAGVLLVLWGIINDLFRKAGKGIWFTGIGTVLTVFSLFLLAGYNNTCFYPSNFDMQSSLNIRNSSSSEFTLTVMSWVSLLVPVVLGYIWFAWRSINDKKIDKEEMENGSHKY
jgi:cytochrome d ubiquinol oxidase subunit II